ncbi:progestin and adipoQ receptor family member 3 isoform X2 [Petromyzon marinus]|uniref:Progestin and adipoQ receptor family member 3 isoform X3 n=1 Tax=Petromyzon marinus TaxID=7757 RepID=A0AAJ7TYG9_PETMA|nr:progestin and adipoQ receptor family member 3 isoform X3 [Petromyzon marinus]
MSHKLLKPVNYMEGGYSYWPVLSPRGIRLYTYEQVPCFLKGNPYITDGYRAYLPSRLCLKSLFIVSNETVNIWSHLFGFLLFFFLGVYDTLVMLPAAQASHDDYIIYTIFLFCFQVCMLCSTGYHLFCCHRSEKTSRRWLALDYAGISVGLLGCYIPGVFYAFYCEEYFSPQWYTTRLVILSCVSLYGVIPTVHWIVLNGGPTTTIVQDFSPRVMIMYLLAGVAFVFYVGKVPERYFPGHVNFVGSSHQCWHILVVFMFYWWHQTAVLIMKYRHSTPCHETSLQL